MPCLHARLTGPLDSSNVHSKRDSPASPHPKVKRNPESKSPKNPSNCDFMRPEDITVKDCKWAFRGGGFELRSPAKAKFCGFFFFFLGGG